MFRQILLIHCMFGCVLSFLPESDLTNSIYSNNRITANGDEDTNIWEENVEDPEEQSASPYKLTFRRRNIKSGPYSGLVKTPFGRMGHKAGYGSYRNRQGTFSPSQRTSAYVPALQSLSNYGRSYPYTESLYPRESFSSGLLNRFNSNNGYFGSTVAFRNKMNQFAERPLDGNKQSPYSSNDLMNSFIAPSSHQNSRYSGNMRSSYGKIGTFIPRISDYGSRYPEQNGYQLPSVENYYPGSFRARPDTSYISNNQWNSKQRREVNEGSLDERKADHPPTESE